MDREDLKNNLLMIARVGLSGAILLLMMVAGLVLSKKVIPGVNPFLVLAAAVGSAVGAFIVFPKLTQRLGITEPDPKRLPVDPELHDPDMGGQTMFMDPYISIDSVTFANMQGLTLVEKNASLLLSDFSFNISYHSPERGYTGLRDAMVAERFFDKYGTMPEDEFNKIWFDYSSNPEAAQRSRADDECYDAEFPEHPLSRCRNFLRSLPTHIKIAPEVRKARAYRD